MANSKLMAGLFELYKCPFYWGEMKRNDAEALFEKKSERGFKTHFLVFYNSDTVKLEILIKYVGNFYSASHYFDPASFEPKLLSGSDLEATFGWKLYPIIRNRAFSLMELSRAQIRKTNITFEAISELECPEALKKFLQEYHVKTK